MTAVSNNESKDIIKKYEKLWNKIEDQIRTITNNSDHYDEKFIKIKFNLDDNLPLNEILEFHNMSIVVRAVFREGNKHYPQGFLDEFLHKI